ncbi:MAG: hypothetical protein US51_C0041G0005 [Microgenomates group bacterium GW2011_GWA2_37_6]|nr:MAG: hypothetical protein US51_C0041G0005 [Microgenomates group bacterium GW2011_GWA2_37_6]
MNKKIVLIFLIVITLIGAVLFFTRYNKNTSQTPETSDSISTDKPEVYSASFAIYTNGTFRIFTAPMYHNLSNDVFIQASNPNIVYVRKSNTTWRDFFATLPMKLDENCLTTGTNQIFCSDEKLTLQFYLNGEKNKSALDQIINPGDKLLVTYEKENAATIQQQLQSIPNPE